MANDAKKPEEKAAKVKRPTAKKRDLQGAKRNLSNRSFKARAQTLIRSFKESAAQKKGADVKAKLNEVYSLIDKGVKKGIVKSNKANRVKSQLSALAK